ncbi:hypothetical protein Q9L58_005840 [Maublancomyces gigas]|uniref:Uncharacterized protein n=1 Tax=Discina gigas TaxID=1032678 RepID=A0ABR3GGX0_9PEZI
MSSVACFAIESDKAYFFKRSDYARIDNINVGKGGDTLAAGPSTIAKTWPSLAQAGFTTVDAALDMGGGTAYFFSGTQYARVDNIGVGKGGDTLGAGPTNITAAWPSLAKAKFTTVDAVLSMGGGTAYFFSGTQYARVDNIGVGKGGDTLGAGPTLITAGWPSLAKAKFTIVDAVLGMGSGKAYFFSGSLYARIDNINVGHGGDTLGAGPSEVASSWESLHKAGFW